MAQNTILANMLSNTTPSPTNGDVSNVYTKDQTDKMLQVAKLDLIEAVKKIEKIDFVLFAVVIVLLFMVATMVIDSFHFNSVTYKEYSDKTQAMEMIQKNNEILLSQIKDLSEENKRDREIIKQLLIK